MKTILALIQKEFRQVRRDRAMLAVIFVMPVIQLFILGFAVNNDVVNLSMAVVDRKASETTRGLIEGFRTSGRFARIIPADRVQDARVLMDQQEVNLILVIPEAFTDAVAGASGRPAPLQIIVDGVESNTALVATGYARGIIRHFFLDRTGTAEPLLHEIALYNPELESAYGYVPGILAVLLTIITMLLTALGLVKEKEIGTLEQLNVTPIRPIQLIAGKILPFAILGGLSFTIAGTVAWFVYGLIMNGTVLTLAVMVLLYMGTTLSLGILASTLAATQQQAVFTTWFFLVVNILMSGFMFPIENMPDALQSITVVIPLKHFITAIREIMLKGASLSDLHREVTALGILSAVLFVLSVLKFRKTA
ncbi:MAG TPA: ABC transporter permease [bacterium]|nr:ABC transporter permease [bacterium]